jgi:hypothetical protein
VDQHTVCYEVLNRRPDEGRHWQIEVQATPEELAQFATSGYLVREELFQGEALERLRQALDRLEVREWEPFEAAKTNAEKRSWGRIPRHLMDKDPVFLELLKFQPALSIARAMMVHGNLWHRALPTVGKKRRMLILSYTPTWLRKSPHGPPQPEDGLTKEVLEDTDEETRVLLGVGGYS